MSPPPRWKAPSPRSPVGPWRMCSGSPIPTVGSLSPRSSRWRPAPNSTRRRCVSVWRPSCLPTRSRDALPRCRIPRCHCSPAARSTLRLCRRFSMHDTIDRLVRRRAEQHGDKPMVIDPATRITYGELDDTTRALVAAFLEAGVGKGTRVGLIMPNCVQWVQIAVALTRIGAVLVPLSTLLQPPELVAQLRGASVQVLIAVEEFRGHRYLDDLGGVVESLELPALREVWTPHRLANPRGGNPVVDAMAAAVTPSDTLVIMFTSGSSGPPTGVIHSHGNALAAVRSGLTARCIDANTRLYLPMPFFWVGGLGSGVLSALLAGGLAALLPADQRGEPGARAKLFGMTESLGPYCGYPADTDMPRSAWGSCGKPFDGMQVRIVDHDTGQPVPPGTVGVIQIRGPHTLRGMCRRSREDLFTPDGYYPTGDLGHLDDDGFMFYDGRSDDMFKVSGATVYPSEVEQALRTI